MFIYIGFSRPRTTKIGAKLISWWIDRPYSHVYVRFCYNNSMDAIFHASHGMVHFRSPCNFHKDNLSIKEYPIELSEAEHDEFFDECMELSGEVYGSIELFKIFISDVAFAVCGKEIKWNNGTGYICSELVGTLLKSRLKMSFCKPVFLLKPDDIDNILHDKYVIKSID
jgi:hypothetical protein